jgi:hypothetical protein
MRHITDLLRSTSTTRNASKQSGTLNATQPTGYDGQIFDARPGFGPIEVSARYVLLTFVWIDLRDESAAGQIFLADGGEMDET